MVFTHAFVGAVASKLYIDKTKPAEESRNLFYLLGIFGSILPDLDIVVILFLPDLHHRYFISHSILLYLGLFIALVIFSKVFKRERLLQLSAITLIGVLTHLLLDLLAGGIALFAPFYSELIGFDIILVPYMPSNRMGWALVYIKSLYMLIEGLLIGLFVYFLRKERNKIAWILPFILLFVSTATLFILSFL